MVKQVNFITLREAAERLANRGSDQDPIFLDGWSGASADDLERLSKNETNAQTVCWGSSQIEHDTKDRAGAVKIRFWGRENRSRRSPRGPFKLLAGTLLDMVREREGKYHSAVSASPFHPADPDTCKKACCNHGKKVPVRKQGLVEANDTLGRAVETGRKLGLRGGTEAPAAWLRVKELRTALVAGRLTFDLGEDFRLGLADTVAMIECRVRGIPVQIQDLFSTDPGDWDFFLAVVDGAVKLETGWKPKPPPPPRSAWDRVYEAIELLLLDVCEREASLAMKQPAKLTVVVPEHLWCQAHQATERIVLAGSPQQADGKVQIAITKIWSNAAPDREVIVDLEAGKKLHGDCVVIRRASGHTYVRVVPAVDSVPDPRWLKLHENDKKRWLHENDKAGETA